MTMRPSRKNRRDNNEPEIVEALKEHDCSVERMDKPADLLVGYKGENYIIEVKSEDGKLTPSQKSFKKRHKGQYSVVRSVDDALAVVGGK